MSSKSSLSTVQSILQNVKVSPNGYSTVSALGSFIGNREFSEGFNAFENNVNDNGKSTFVWESLSAIADDLGEVVYDNVKHYVDYASNVDLCKVIALKSMMTELGFTKTPLDYIEYVPLEVRNLMDILSINRKYLLDSGYYGQKFREDLICCNVLKTKYVPSDVSSMVSDAIQETTVVDDDAYQAYLFGLYKTLLSGFCSLQYIFTSEADALTLKAHYYIYNTLLDDSRNSNIWIPRLTSNDTNGDEEDYTILRFIRDHNISPLFQYQKIVDDIEEELDTLSNYMYPQRDLLELELSSRQAVVTRQELKKAADSEELYMLDMQNVKVIKNQGRYAYYRKKKVQEYINFINHKWFLDSADSLNKYDQYWKDNNYIVLHSNVSSVISERNKLDERMIDHVAKYLMVTTEYIRKLRERLKLQVRKIYMKGTQNLLLHMVNEYLIDYSTHRAMLNSDYISSVDPHVYSQLKEISLSGAMGEDNNEINIIEYYDDTDYYNQKTFTTPYAVNSDSAVKDFWKERNMSSEDGAEFSLQEISSFYYTTMRFQDSMNMTRGISSCEMMADFLDAIYGIGADNSYIDMELSAEGAKYNGFTCLLSAHNRLSKDVLRDWQKLNSNYSTLTSTYIPATYSYPSKTISEQASSTLSAVLDDLNKEYLSGIGEVSDTYTLSIDALSSKLATMKEDYRNYISGDYIYYFKKSESKYSYVDENPITGEYKHDYYIGNDVYEVSPDYYNTTLTMLKSYLDGKDDQTGTPNITNFALVDTLSGVYDSCRQISSSYKSEVVSKLTSGLISGFYEIGYDTLDEELGYALEYIISRESRRMTFLTDQLNNIRTQANEMKTSYESVNQNFNACMAGYQDDNPSQDISQGEIYCVALNHVNDNNTICDGTLGNAVRRDDADDFTYSEDDYTINWVSYCATNGKYYGHVVKIKDGNTEDVGTYPYLITKYTPITDELPLEGKIASFLTFLKAPTAFTVLTTKDSEGHKAYTIGNYYYANMREGTYLAATQCKANLEDLQNSLDNLVEQIKAIGGLLDLSTDNNSLAAKIDRVIKYISTEYSESNFENDPEVRLCRELKVKVKDLSAQYLPYKQDFHNIVNDGTQVSYLDKYPGTKEALTFQNIKDLLSYAKETDFSNSQILQKFYDEEREKLNTLNGRYDELANILGHLEYEYWMGGWYVPYQDYAFGIVEVGISGMYDFIAVDYNRKESDCRSKIQSEYDIAKNCIKEVTDFISADYSSTDSLSDVIDRKLSFLDIYADKQYLNRYQQYLEYSGNRFSYYPYFPWTNVTHPSYQVHPYLWNFIEADNSIVSLMTKTLQLIDVEEFHKDKYKKKISTYFGEYGQSINKWMNPFLYDYTSYTTRYESSNHNHTSTAKFSEAVDYDGLFYPPAAAEFFRDADQCIASIRDKSTSSSSAKTFYEKYYEPLDIGDVELNIISCQLNEHKDLIKNVISAAGHSAFDIYRYGLDSNENIYVLLKQYDYDNAAVDGKIPFKEKRNTLGSLWIRLKDHPIAFPALKGQYPAAYITNYEDIPPQVKDLKGISNPDIYSSLPLSSILSDDCNAFYDFDISKNGQYLYMVVQNFDIAKEHLSNKQIANYENAQVFQFTTTVQQERNDGDKRVDLYSSPDAEENIEGKTITQYVRSGNGKDIITSLRAFPSEPIDNYAFLGIYLKNQTTTKFIYAKKRYTPQDDGTLDVQLLDEIKAIPFRNGKYTGNSLTSCNNINDPYNDQICFTSYMKNNQHYLAFVYLQKAYLDNVATTKSAKSSSQTNLLENTDGHVYGDPRSNEMNSHDIFTANIAEFTLRDTESRLTSNLNNTFEILANTNADMSYIPVYPGISGEVSVMLPAVLSAELTSDFSVEKHIYRYGKPFELLGDSNDIDKQIRLVNTDVDPYFQLSTIREDYVFGRVYEDWPKDWWDKDNSLRMFSSPAMNFNPVNPYHSADGKALEYTIDLAPFAYSNHNYYSLNLLIYNRDTLGKNPYFIGKLKALAADSYMSSILNYNPAVESDNSRETHVTTDYFAGDDFYLNVTGTGSAYKYLNYSDTNHIPNISKFKAYFDNSTQQLKLRLEVDDIEQKDFTYIKDGEIQILLYDVNNLKIFEYYHYLDAYGAVNAYHATVEIPDDIYEDGWSIHFNKDYYDEMNVLRTLQSYYYDKDQNKRFLKDLNLSYYSHLSNVYILQGDKKLSLKYSDEDIFDFNSENYYFPTLNYKYPKLISEYVESTSCSLNNAMNAMQLDRVFGEGNLYILDLADESEISALIDAVEVPIEREDEDVLFAFEKYSVFSDLPKDERTISATFKKYDEDDSRALNDIIFDEYYTNIPDEYTSVSKSNIEQRIAALSSNCYSKDYLAALDSLYTSGKNTKILPFGNESYKEVRYASEVMNITGIDIKDLLKIYVNYKAADDGITLYFNYFNYLNTPYIRIEGTKYYPQVIDTTYLKLKPGEEGTLDIIVQFKCYDNEQLIGTKLGTLLTYKITNTSDDKPKFLINEVYRIKKDSLTSAAQAPKVKVTVSDINVSTSGANQSAKPTINMPVSVISDKPLTPFTIGLEYPYDLFKISSTAQYDGFSVDTNVANGYAVVKVSDPTIRFFNIEMQSQKTKAQLNKLKGKYRVEISDVHIVGENGLTAEVETSDGSIEVTA